jgi:hypothetical protein
MVKALSSNPSTDPPPKKKAKKMQVLGWSLLWPGHPGGKGPLVSWGHCAPPGLGSQAGSDRLAGESGWPLFGVS